MKLGSNAAGATVTPTMALTIRGNTSNLSSSVSAVTGVMTTANVAQIQSVIASANTGVTFVPASSPVGQLVVAGQSAFNIGTMNVKATNGVAGGTLKDISFVVPANTIGSVTINGKTASIIGTAATITDVGVNVPADASGVNVPVTVSLVCVNSTGGCAGVSNSALTLSLTGYTYNDGVNVISTTTAARLLSANHNLVASKPALTVAQSSTGGLSNGNVKLGEVTISADAAGDIEITQLPVTIASTSGITVSNMMVKDSSGSSVIVGTSGSNGTTVLAGSGNFVFSSARKIAKGTSETYTIYGTVAGVSGAANTANITFSVGAATSFLWNDVMGAQTGIDGSKMYNYPTNTQTKSN
jgi:hypothetical protein